MSHLFICELRIMAIGATQNTTIDTCVDEKGDGSLRVVCLSVLGGILDKVEVKAEAEREKAEWLSGWGSLSRRTTNLPGDYYHRCDELWVSSADVNDLRSKLVSRLSRCLWLQWNGDAEGECYAPFLCAHFWVGMPFNQFVGLLGKQYGRDLS